jgi:hypothetical protein
MNFFDSYTNKFKGVELQLGCVMCQGSMSPGRVPYRQRFLR